MTGTFAHAEQLLAAQRYGEAISFCEEQLAQSPRCVTLRLLYGKALLARRQPAAATAAFEECLRVDPSCTEARELLEGALAARPISFARPTTMEALAELARPPTLESSSEFSRPPTLTPAPSLMSELRSSTIVIRGGNKKKAATPVPMASSSSTSTLPERPRPASRPTPPRTVKVTPLPSPLPPPAEEPATAQDVALPPLPSLALPKGARPALGRTGQIRQVSPPPTPERGLPPLPKRAPRRKRLSRPVQSAACLVLGLMAGSVWWSAERQQGVALPAASIAQPRAAMAAPASSGMPVAAPGALTTGAAIALHAEETPASTDKAQLAEIMGDVWIHPLLGPTRRMPLRGSRLFGAERLGDRPSECLGGHCGVDLGGKLGEAVLAVHDGIVDKVQRASNADHGGHYVRIAHRDGNIFSQYFHLGPIPRGLVPGTPVKAGDVIGYVGMTGVKRSGPHLHFTIAIQDSPASQARYVDPEPLVALWPVRLPASDGEQARLSASVPAGVARGFTQRHFRYGRVRHGSKSVDRAD